MIRKSYILLFVLALIVIGGAWALDRHYTDQRDAALRQSSAVTMAAAPAAKLIEPEATELMYGEELLEAMRGGGYVLFVRHFQTDHSMWHEDPIKGQHHVLKREDFLTCENQRPLTEVGRMRATLVGRLMKKQRIPIGKILSSPYCRATESVKLMFGREPDESPYGLIYRGGGYTDEMSADFIRPLLGQKPESGSNTLIMAHRTQMDSVGDIAEGQVFVFEPLGDEKFNLVGKIFDYEWMESLETPSLFGLTSMTKLPDGYTEGILKGLDF
ncbi:MAG TPA: hypothetical protein VLK65_14345 [Vicinamibacteria bacterium]|nr:hypothetical protein [Vicinamibacteria bacterium]